MPVVTVSTGINFAPATSEGEDVIVYFVLPVQGVSATQVTDLEVHETHIRYRWVSPDDGGETTVFVPWSNIVAIRQVVTV